MIVTADESPCTDSEIITLAQAASELPCRRAGRPTSVATLYLWTKAGCRGERLRYVQVGATRCTTRAWLAEFFGRLTLATEAPSQREVAQCV